MAWKATSARTQWSLWLLALMIISGKKNRQTYACLFKSILTTFMYTLQLLPSRHPNSYLFER